MFTKSITKTQLQMGSTKSIDNLFTHCCNEINEHPNRRFRLLFRFANNNSGVFSIEKLNCAVISSLLQKVSTLTIARFTTSKNNGTKLQTRVEKNGSNYDVYCLQPSFILGRTKAFLKLWERVLSKNKVFGYNLCAQKDYSIS